MAFLLMCCVALGHGFHFTKLRSKQMKNRYGVVRQLTDWAVVDKVTGIPHRTFSKREEARALARFMCKTYSETTAQLDQQLSLPITG
jgi:hypothetical protein